MGVCGAKGLIGFGKGELDLRMLFSFCKVCGLCSIRCLKESWTLNNVATPNCSSYE